MSPNIFQYILAIFLSKHVIYGATIGPSLKQVQSLESAMNDLQKEIQIQEQANAKVLTDILSQLATTTDQLIDVTSNYTTVEAELEAVKQANGIKERALEAEIATLRDQLNEVTNNYTTLETELEAVNQTNRVNDLGQEAEMATLRDQLHEVTSNNTAMESELEAVKQTYMIKEHAQEGEIAKLKRNLESMNKQVNVLTSAVLNLQSYQQAQSIHDQEQDLILNSTQTDLNKFLGDLLDLQANVSSLEIDQTMNRTCAMQVQQQEQLYLQAMVQLNDTDSLVHHLNEEYSSLKTELDGLSSNCSLVGNEVELVLQKDKTMEHDLSNLTTNFGLLEKDVYSMQKQIFLNSKLNSTINKFGGDINALEVNMTSSLFAINQDLTALQKATKNTKDKNSTNVAFETSPSVSVTGSKDYGADETIIFSQPLYNEGDGYDTATGRFIAPVSGTYLFWANVAFTNHSSILIQMKKNGAYFGSVYGALLSRTSTGSTSGVNGVILKRGDVVTFSSSTPITLLDGLCWLGGALVHES